MKKNNKSKNRQVASTANSSTPKLLTSLLLIAYGYVTVLTPNFRTFDSNGPKFLSFAILNVVAFLALFSIKEIRNNKKYLFGFFDGKVGLAYSVLIIFSLLSFTKSINISESILHFAKFFTPFAAAWTISVIVRYDKNALKPLAVMMTILLFVDSFQVFRAISDYSKGKITNLIQIKSSYSNRNILASAIFVKIPFALWLFIFHKKILKYLGAIVSFCGFLAILFLGARAFYLGSIFISIILPVYFVREYLITKNKNHLHKMGYYFMIILLAFGTSYFVQHFVYQKSKRGVGNFASKMSSIVSTNNRSNNLRFMAWKYSGKMIKKDPFLGVGLGNWKIRVLEYENQESVNYTYLYKNHNDFIETTVESGIIAGLAFLSIFLFILWYFAVVLFKNPSNKDDQKLLFLPALGIVAYSFDAFFNFPQDRPEIQSLFAVYIGIAAGIALVIFKEDSPLYKFTSKINKKPLQAVLLGLTSVLLIACTYMLYINVQSLKLQRVVKEELNSKKLKSSSERFLKGFPSIPNITILEEPIAVQKARYLINEKKYDEARAILRDDKSNPFDGRKEYFMTITYYTQKKYDSALVYAKLTHKIKPLFYNNNTILASIYERTNRPKESLKMWKEYLKRVKNNAAPWLYAAQLSQNTGNLAEAKTIIDSAYRYHPKDTKIKSFRESLELRTKAGSHLPIYDKAVLLYRNKKYKECIPVFKQFLDKVPNHSKSYELRSVAYFNIRDYNSALNDINMLEKLGTPLNANMINIQGSSYLMINNMKEAERLFKKAMKMGSKDAAINYKKFFSKKK